MTDEKIKLCCSRYVISLICLSGFYCSMKGMAATLIALQETTIRVRQNELWHNLTRSPCRFVRLLLAYRFRIWSTNPHHLWCHRQRRRSLERHVPSQGSHIRHIWKKQSHRYQRLYHRDDKITYPACLSKQKTAFLTGSRVHHSFPWSFGKVNVV